jgi:hypothetical protein
LWNKTQNNDINKRENTWKNSNLVREGGRTVGSGRVATIVE